MASLAVIMLVLVIIGSVIAIIVGPGDTYV